MAEEKTQEEQEALTGPLPRSFFGKIRDTLAGKEVNPEREPLVSPAVSSAKSVRVAPERLTLLSLLPPRAAPTRPPPRAELQAELTCYPLL